MLIGYRVIESQNRQTKANVRRLFCEVGGCEMYERSRQCIHAGTFDSCMHGKASVETGYTRRARSYHEWVRARRAEGADFWPNAADKKVAIVGKYLWLPAHTADWIEEIPFVRHGNHIWSGKPFVKLADFKPEHVVALARHSPRRLMDHTIIKEYRHRDLPMMLDQIRDLLPDIYQQALELDPKIAEIDMKLENIVSVTVPLRLIPTGWEWDVPGKGRVVGWDGETLRVEMVEVPITLYGWGNKGCTVTFYASLSRRFTLTEPRHVAYFYLRRPDEAHFEVKQR